MNTQKGFTLVETLVAITVLALALVGPFSAVENSLFGSYVARDQLVAAALAQEGVEYLRSIRDNNYLNSRSWVDGFNGYTQCYSATIGVTPTGTCTVDSTRGDFHNDPTAMQGYLASQQGSVPYIKVDRTYYFYTYEATNSDDTKFKRTVRIETLSDTEIRVTVTVAWITGRQSYSMSVTDTLQDWL